MTRTTIWTLVLSLALVSAAGAAPTPEEKCQAAKLNALRKRTFCIEGERREEVLGITHTANCELKFATAITRAGTSCRWLGNADGTATDLNSGLQWELKTDDGSVHDKDNTYTWTSTIGGTTPNGTAFVGFLGTLNYDTAELFGKPIPCFAHHCDWRLPTIFELLRMLDCNGITPCTTIPGSTVSGSYWSLTSSLPLDGDAFVASPGWGFSNKIDANYVRAVRGGSAIDS